MVGDGAVHRDGGREPSSPQELREHFNDEHDFDVEFLTEVLGVVLGEADVVVRVQDEDALGPRRAPIVEVVACESLGLVDVAHLGGGAAAAPLVLHQAELVAGHLQHLGHRAGNRRAVEGGLTVDEEDRVSADGDVQAGRPVAHLVLADRCLPEDGLVCAQVGALVPRPPLRLVDTALDRKGAHRLDHIDGPRAEAIEITSEQRVGAAQLAGAALGAVDVVGSDVGNLELAALHRHDVGVKGGGRPRLVALDLRHRADLAAELVPRGEAVVRGVAPLLDERGGLRVGQRSWLQPGERLGVLVQFRSVCPRSRSEGLRERVGASCPPGLDLCHGAPWNMVW